MDESEKILLDQFKKLPKELQDFVANPSWTTECEALAKKYGFTEEETESLRFTVLFTLTGLIAREDMSNSLISDLGIQKIVALDIQNEVAEKILSRLSPEALAALQNNEDRPLNPATNLIEDSKGNADNVLPSLPGEKEVTKVAAVAKAPRPVEIKQTAPNSPQIAPQKPEPTLTDAEWEARKKALEAGELVMKTAYGSKPDPYREPTA